MPVRGGGATLTGSPHNSKRYFGRAIRGKSTIHREYRIGLVAGVLVVESAVFLERKLKVDDPVGAISVHGTCGAWGVISLL